MRIYMRRFRFRENLDVAGYLLIVSALNALALVTWDTIAYNTGALNGKVRSELLCKVGLNMTNCFFLQICGLFTTQTYYEIPLLTITDPVCMFALYSSLVTFEGRRTMRSALLVTSLFVAEGRVCMYEFFHRLASIYV